MQVGLFGLITLISGLFYILRLKPTNLLLADRTYYVEVVHRDVHDRIDCTNHRALLATFFLSGSSRGGTFLRSKRILFRLILH